MKTRIEVKENELDLILEALEEYHTALSDCCDNLPKVRSINDLWNLLDDARQHLAIERQEFSPNGRYAPCLPDRVTNLDRDPGMER